jgi:DNA-binding NarL/FixJ family response regulator
MTVNPRILVVDNHASVRAGIRTFLEANTNFTVCGEAEDGVGAIEQAKLLRPDVVILDLSLPKLNGTEVASVLKGGWPRVKVVAFSMYADELGRAVRVATRIDAVLSKSAGLKTLVEIIQRLFPAEPMNPSQPGSPQSSSA